MKGGKTYALLLECIREKDNPNFGAVIFRRNAKQIRNEGGLWDESNEIFPWFKAKPRESVTSWQFPSGARVKFDHLERDGTVLNWQGSQIAMIGFDELTHFCLTGDTEVLTSSGWKNIKDVKVKEKVASLNSERKIEYQSVLDTPSFDYNGKMAEVSQKNGVSFNATPNHEMVIRRQDDKKSLGKKRLDSWGHDSIERTGEWKGGKEYKSFPLEKPVGRGHGRNSNSFLSIDADVWFEFLGWYLSEGCSFRMKNRTKSPVISLRQTKEHGKKKIREVLNKLPWRFSETKDGQFKIFSTQLFKIVNPMGNSYKKRVPEFIKNASKRQMKLFWNAFVDGDGHRTKSGAITIGLANSLLIDDLQEIAFKLGLIATKGGGVNKKGFKYWTLNVSKDTRKVTQVKNDVIKWVDYKGKVYCLTVNKNHNFLIRHNGRYCWSGNSQKQFFYMMSRNRSNSGVPGYIRATTNPDVDSWVRRLIDWWIGEDGYPIEERSGVVRYFIRIDDAIHWGDSKQELIDKYGVEEIDCKSLTFIPSKLQDNKILMDKDPSYLSNLKALPKVEKLRLLGGNWNIKASAGDYFQRDFFEVIDTLPGGWTRCVRYWDRASTKPNTNNKNPDWTRGVKMYSYPNGTFVVADVRSLRDTPLNVEKLIKNTASQDGDTTRICLEQDPGQAGEADVQYLIRQLQGYDVRAKRVSKDKVTRALGYSAQCEAGNVKILKGEWNEEYLLELENFPPEDDTQGIKRSEEDKGKDDQVDASSGAFNELTENATVFDSM